MSSNSMQALVSINTTHHSLLPTNYRPPIRWSPSGPQLCLSARARRCCIRLGPSSASGLRLQLPKGHLQMRADTIALSIFPTQPDRLQLDISKLQATDLAPLHAQLWLSSPSCQPYTVLNPNAQGDADPRAASFLHLISVVLPALATTQDHPEYILIENVAGFEVRTHLIST
jgi:hypothetical protein